VETRRGLPGDPDDTHSRYIEAAIDGILVGCLYLPNGNPAPGLKFDYKLRMALVDRDNPHKEVRFAGDSPLEGNGFELPVRGSREGGLSPLFLRRLLGTGGVLRFTFFFMRGKPFDGAWLYDIDGVTPLALIAARFEDRVHLAESLHRGQSAAGSEAPA
jgi:hypothetical protein